MPAWDPSTNFVNQDITTGQGRVSAASRTRSNSAFIPELWEDDVLAAYKANLVMPQLVNKLSFVGKKGDTVHIPLPVRGQANRKASQSSVTLNADQSTSKPLLIDNHFEYSSLIEDIAEIQASDSLRKFLTDDAGYALAVQTDTELHGSAAFLNAGGLGTVTDVRSDAASAYDGAAIGSDGSAWDPAASGGAGNGASIADVGIRNMIQYLDDNDAPIAGRSIVIPPSEKNILLGIERFTEQAFVGEIGMGNSIRNGRVGDVYGVEIYVSTNCPTVQADDTSTNYRACLMLQEDALILTEQLKPRVQANYEQQFLSTLMTADSVFGTDVLRSEAGIPFLVPA